MSVDRASKDDCKINFCSPSDTDVLCGRGAPINKHPGNILFRKVVKCNKELYGVCEKQDRYYLAKSIVMALEEQDPPTRFLEQHDDGNSNFTWTTISKQRAIRKTVQALREKPSSMPFKTMQKKNSEYSEKNKAWQNLLENMMPGSLLSNDEYTDDNSKKSFNDRKRPRTKEYSPIPDLVVEVSPSDYQELMNQMNSSNSNDDDDDCTSEDDTSCDEEYQKIVSQTMCNAMKEEISGSSIPLSSAETDFHVNITDPVNTCSMSMEQLTKESSSPQIGFGLISDDDESSSLSIKSSDDDEAKKQIDMLDEELSPDDILVDDLLTSEEEDAKFEKFF